MPNRIIKESICTSENIDQLTEFQEIFFYRLMVNCDDFGRFDARLKLLASKLFPLRDITTEKVAETLDALRDADLIIVYEVKGHPYLQMKTWEKHQQGRAIKSKYPSFAESILQEDESDCNQLQSIDINCNQEQSDDSKCPRIRNRNRNTISDNRNRETREDDDDDFHKIQSDHDRVLNAAEDAGFKMSNDVRATLIALYADHGLQKLLDGMKSCVDHGAPNLAYLKAVLKGEPRKDKSPGKTVTAQQYSQRSYDGEQEAAMRRMLDECNSTSA